MRETLGERVRRLRLDRGYTVAGLARAVEVTEGTIRNIERDVTRDPALTTGLRIAHALGVSVPYLGFGEEGWKPNE